MKVSRFVQLRNAPGSHVVLAALLAASSVFADSKISGSDRSEDSERRANLQKSRIIDDFKSHDSFDDIVKRIPDLKYRGMEIPEGEGFCRHGFEFGAGTDGHFVAVWRDFAMKKLDSVSFLGSDWKTQGGIRLGLTLKELETLNNGWPFRLTGFNWDYAGTVLSFGKGSLKKKAIVRLGPSTDASPMDTAQVQGDIEFSSGHPVMQKLNPTVYDIGLRFDHGPPGKAENQSFTCGEGGSLP